MAMDRTSVPITALKTALFLAFGSSVSAQNLAQIDSELSAGIDFRQSTFSVCLGRTECSVAGLSVLGQRRLTQESDWISAPIYWDPIDGLGIEDGAQNDVVCSTINAVI